MFCFLLTILLRHQRKFDADIYSKTYLEVNFEFLYIFSRRGVSLKVEKRRVGVLLFDDTSI